MPCFNYKIKHLIVHVIASAVLVLCLAILLTSCTEYERQGINSRPFNEPAEWEMNPYGNAFCN